MPNPKVVVLCMENRSFDEYFGTFPGAIGFYDPNGVDVFRQPHIDGKGKRVFISPFRASTFANYVSADPNHSWLGAQTAWNGGKMDGWSAAQVNTFFTSMSYYAANDIPYHWQLAQTFLLCDTYFCSVLGPTWPNRLYLMSGTIFPSPPEPGTVKTFNSNADLPALNSQNATEFPWKSYAAMLGSKITWTLYDDQQWKPPWMVWPSGTSFPPSYVQGSWKPWDLNMLDCLRDAKGNDNKRPGTSSGPSANYQATAADAAASKFETDAASGNLPAISWLVPPFYCTEHPNHFPWDGECYLARVVDAVLQSPDWGDPGIVLIITYDENGGFFDHVRPPTSQEFNSDDEAWVQEVESGTGAVAGPVGGGFRIPAIIVSPWTVGAGTSSKLKPDLVFDHTSVIQYLEEITGKTCENLPKPGWRRSTFSSLSPMIDTKKTAVPASNITLPSLDTVYEWRADALTRLYGADSAGNASPVLPQPWPEPTQNWPPLRQTCYFIAGTSMFDRSASEGQHVVCSGVFSFVSEGYVPSELNLGQYVPASFSPLKPKIEVTIFPTEDCVPGTEIVAAHSPEVEIGDAVSDNLSYPSLPQTFRFPCNLIFAGDPPASAVWIRVDGTLTSRLTWKAPSKVMRLAVT